MATLHSTPKIIQVGLVNENGEPVLLNNSKQNKNIIGLYGLFIFGLIFHISFGFGFSSRFGWITVSQGAMSFFVYFCCFPVLLPTIYFMRNPRHLILVLKDHRLM